MRIEICGGIATGKTSLARALSCSGVFSVVHERVAEVPFWEKFYTAPTVYAFEKNVSFLMFHADSVRDAQAAAPPAVLCDFAMFQDLAYGVISLPNSADLAAFRAVYDRLMTRIGPPSLLLRLRCSMDTQLARIRRRGRLAEQGIDRHYLGSLNAAIDDALDAMRTKTALEVVDIDTDTDDFVANVHAKALHSRLMCYLPDSAVQVPY